MIDKYWMDAVADACKANAKRTISITGSLAIAMGGWLILNAAATKGPAEFFDSTCPASEYIKHLCLRFDGEVAMAYSLFKWYYGLPSRQKAL